MKNKLGLKTYSLRKLRVGQSALLGPYLQAKSATAKFNQLRRRYPEEFTSKTFIQRQVLLVDPKTTETWKMYLVTRTA